MNTRPWWGRVVQWGLWAVAMTLVMGWLARSRTEPREPQDAQQLGASAEHPHHWAGLRRSLPDARRPVGRVPWQDGIARSDAVVCRVCGARAPPGPGVSQCARHAPTPDGLRYGKLLGGTGALRWDEVRRLSYSQSAKWFRLELADGRVVRVSAMLVGLPTFAQAALGGVPPAAVDPEARAILEATAAGERPRIWG